MFLLHLMLISTLHLTSGGTVDVTIHEVSDGQTVNEVYQASGGGWGGNNVNHAFEILIKDVFGESVYNSFCEEYPDEHLELLNDFERKKRIVSPHKDNDIRFHMPVSLMDSYKQENKNELERGITRSKYSGKIKVSRNKMDFSVELIRPLFKKSIDSIVNHVRQLLSNVEVDAILMVGGFSDSPMLQEAIKLQFKKIHIVIPKDAATSVLKGALIFGHRPRQIIQRVLKYTYGIESHRPFQRGDPKGKRIKTDQGVLCCHIFDVHVKKGQAVDVGEIQAERSYKPLVKSQLDMTFRIFASELESPTFTDQYSTLVGVLTVDHSGIADSTVKVGLLFGETEITVIATEEQTGIQTHAEINFLDLAQ